MGAAEPVHATLSIPHLIRLFIVNTIVLVELCIAMYIAAQAPAEIITAVFFRVLLSLLVPTLILSTYTKRFMPVITVRLIQRVPQ